MDQVISLILSHSHSVNKDIEIVLSNVVNESQVNAKTLSNFHQRNYDVVYES